MRVLANQVRYTFLRSMLPLNRRSIKRPMHCRKPDRDASSKAGESRHVFDQRFRILRPGPTVKHRYVVEQSSPVQARALHIGSAFDPVRVMVRALHHLMRPRSIARCRKPRRPVFHRAQASYRVTGRRNQTCRTWPRYPQANEPKGSEEPLGAQVSQILHLPSFSSTVALPVSNPAPTLVVGSAARRTDRTEQRLVRPWLGYLITDASSNHPRRRSTDRESTGLVETPGTRSRRQRPQGLRFDQGEFAQLWRSHRSV
jgi:hypothetical protein